MLTFGKTRTVNAIKKLAAQKGWLVNSDQYDDINTASDYIKVMFRMPDAIKTGNNSFDVRGHMLVSMINGRFFGQYHIGKDSGTPFSSDDAKFDNEAWFVALLKLVYTPAKKVAAPTH